MVEPYVVTIPIKTVNPMNERAHWSKVYKRSKDEKRITLSLFRPPIELRSAKKFLVKIVRIGPRPIDKDGAIASTKYVQDTIAHVLGIDDGDDERVDWQYGREKGPYGVRIELRVEQ